MVSTLCYFNTFKSSIESERKRGSITDESPLFRFLSSLVFGFELHAGCGESIVPTFILYS